MAEKSGAKSGAIQYPVCLLDARCEGRIFVDLDSFLRFNAWIDHELVLLEQRMTSFRRRRRSTSRRSSCGPKSLGGEFLD